VKAKVRIKAVKSVELVVTADGDWTVSVMKDVVTDAAENCSSYKAETARSHHDHRRAFDGRQLDDRFTGTRSVPDYDPSVDLHTLHPTISKLLACVLAAFTTANNVIIVMDRKNGGTLGYFAFHVTSTSQLLREVNKFLLAYAILFECVNFRQYFVYLRKRILIL